MTDSISRSRLLRLAVISSLSGKGVSVITQLLALPLAVEALGLESFGVYAMLTAVFLWANAASALVGSALTLKIVSARASNDKTLEVRLFSTAFFFALIVAGVLAILFQLAIHFADLGKLFGLSNQAYITELFAAASWMAILLPFNIVVSLAESVQSGYQKQYVTSNLLTLANVFVIASLVWVQRNPSIAAMVLAVFLPPIIARLVNLAILWRSNPHLLPHWKLASRSTLGALIVLGAGFFFMQLGSFAYQQFPVLYVGREVGLNSAAYFAAMMQVIAISGSFLVIFTQPLLPAVGDAAVRQDFAWIKIWHRRAITRLIPYIALASIAIMLFGSTFLTLLLRHEAQLDLTTRSLWAAFFFIVAWEHIGYIFLAGIGKLWLATALYLLGALVMLIAMFMLVPHFGLAGAFAAMCLGPLIFTVATYPKLLRGHIVGAATQLLPI